MLNKNQFETYEMNETNSYSIHTNLMLIPNIVNCILVQSCRFGSNCRWFLHVLHHTSSNINLYLNSNILVSRSRSNTTVKWAYLVLANVRMLSYFRDEYRLWSSMSACYFFFVQVKQSTKLNDNIIFWTKIQKE